MLRRRGTTAAGCELVKKNVVVAVVTGSDSRQSVGGKLRRRDEKMTDALGSETRVKKFDLLPEESEQKIIGIVAGDLDDFLSTTDDVKKAAAYDIYHNKSITVGGAATILFSYLQGLLEIQNAAENAENNHQPETKNQCLVSGWNGKECQLWYVGVAKVAELDQRLVKRVKCYEVAGCGGIYAQTVLRRRYRADMSIDDAKDMIVTSLVFASLIDKNTGGNIRVYCVGENGVETLYDKDAVRAYKDTYNAPELKNANVLLILHRREDVVDTHDAGLTDYFRKIVTGNFYVHCFAVKVNFIVHRLLLNKEDYDNILNLRMQKPRLQEIPMCEQCPSAFTLGIDNGEFDLYVEEVTPAVLDMIIEMENSTPAPFPATPIGNEDEEEEDSEGEAEEDNER